MDDDATTPRRPQASEEATVRIVGAAVRALGVALIVIAAPLVLLGAVGLLSDSGSTHGGLAFALAVGLILGGWWLLLAGSDLAKGNRPV